MSSVAQGLDRFPSLIAALCLAVFVTYGSLLPLDFSEASWSSVLPHFLGLDEADIQLRSRTDWATNVAIFVPLGFFGLASVYRRRGALTGTTRALLTLAGCLLLSVGIEFAQLFFPPRDSSVLDVIANALGAALGIIVWFIFGKRTIAGYRALADLHHSTPSLPNLTGRRRLAVLAACGLLIAAWGGFFTTGWTGWHAAITRLNGVRVLPFVEHQAAAIGLALISTMFAVFAYAPLGAALWLANASGARRWQEKLVAAGFVAAGVALLVEGVKLFLVAKRPDSGNIVIAALAAGGGYFLAPLAAKMFIGHGVGRALAAKGQDTATVVGTRTALLAGRMAAVSCAIGAGALVAYYPVGQAPLAVALLIYVVILKRYPTSWLVVVPALLPVLDLAPWTGSFFFDEFDGLLLATLAAGLWRAAGRPLAASLGLGFWLLAAAFSASFLISAIIGLLPLQPFDANALASHYSHYSALRLLKGLVFAVGLALLLSSHAAAGEDVKETLCKGMILGLATATGSVIWERLAYVGIADFTQIFRVTGLFSTMHTGGAHLDAFLVTTLPFAAVWALRSRQPISRLAGALLSAAGSYAVMVTFSRAAVAGLAIAVLVVTGWALLSGRRTAGRSAASTVTMVAGLALAAMASIPVFLGSFMQSRLTTTAPDFEIRTDHWNDAVSMMTDNWTTRLFGMGLGRYPETHLLLSRENNKPAVHRFASEAGNTFLSIRPGRPLYIDQIVSVAPGRDHMVRMKARTGGGKAAVNVLLCDRTFLYGFDCQSLSFQLSGHAGQWQQLQATLNSANVGKNPLRLTKLSLENAGSELPIDLDDVALLDPDGKDLLANGNFQSGADRWFFASPHNHLPWHIKNLWLEVFFNQGWIGLLLFCALTTAATVRLAMATLSGQAFAAAQLAALLALLAVGTFDSIFDAPRLTLIFGLLIAATAIIDPRAKSGTGKPHSTKVAATGVAAEWKTAPPTALTSTGASLKLDWQRATLEVMIGVLILAASIAIVTRLPFVPYNVRELANPFHPLVAPLLLAAVFSWVFGLPAFFARWLAVANNRSAAYPLLVIAHGLIAWVMLQFAVLPEAIHDVIGTPTLNWPLQVEYVARFVPLVSILSIQLTGGALLAAALNGRRLGTGPAWWFFSMAFMFPIQYWVVVSQASTDNLTELMAGNASVGACLLLSSYMLLIGTTGSLLAGLRSGAGSRRIALALAMVAVSLPLGWLLLSTGTEAVVVKEAKAFSALQFLLSTDREHYATGREFWSRFVIAHLGAILLVAFAQYPLWDRFPDRLRARRRRKRPLETTMLPGA